MPDDGQSIKSPTQDSPTTSSPIDINRNGRLDLEDVSEILDHAISDPEGDHTKHAISAVLYALFFNALIAGLKLSVASFTKSAALFAEGLHSSADAFNSVTLLIGIYQGKRAPDRSRPFGYGLETNFWALFASFILFLSALVSIWMGWQRLNAPPENMENIIWAVVILIASIIFEVFALGKASSAVLQEVGIEAKPLDMIPTAFRHIGRVQSPTTRFVFFEDSVAILGAIIALVSIYIGELGVHYGWLPESIHHWPDAIASMVIGVLLLILAVNLFSYNRSFLTGAAASATIEKRIRKVTLETQSISAILDLRTIDQGISGLFAQIKVEVDPDIAIRDVDDIVEHLKNRLKKHVPKMRDVIVEAVADEREENWSDAFHKMIDDAEQHKLLRQSEAMIFRNVFEFAECELQDVMIPRTDVIMVEQSQTVAEAADILIEHRHSKLPVYNENVDNLVGLIHERDILRCIRGGFETALVSTITRDIPIYPENKVLSDILEDFKRDRFQMAAIVDEHGGFAGMVTISDVVEELVGELWEDQEDFDSEDIKEISTTLWELSGRCEIEDLNHRLNMTLPDDEFQTIAGFVFGQLGREPLVGDTIQYEDYIFTVHELDGLRIKTLRLNSGYPLRRKKK